jgi:YesN/AraC family two-component response regulator
MCCSLDYLLKPFDRERFQRSIERVRAELAEPDHSDLEERVRRLLSSIPGWPAPARQILVREAERAFFLAVETFNVSPPRVITSKFTPAAKCT